MKTLTVNIPDETDEKELNVTLAAVLFDKGLLSSGQAADFTGKSKRDFLENVGKYGVSIFDETIEDLR